MLRFLTKKRYDLPLHRGSGGAMLIWIIGMMAYLAALSMLLIIGLNSVTKGWTEGLDGRLTIEIPYNDTDNFGDTVPTLIDILNMQSGITATSIEKSSVLTMIEPWFGAVDDPDSLPLPLLIDVNIAPDQPINMDDLSAKITNIEPTAILNTHQDWMQDVMAFARAIRMVILGLGAVMIVTGIIAVSGAARTRLSLHAQEVALLHQIGADDQYIARQFQRQSLRLAMEGACIGVIMALATLWLAMAIGPSIHDTLMPGFHLSPIHYLYFLIIPMAAGLVAMITGRMTVLFALKKMP